MEEIIRRNVFEEVTCWFGHGVEIRGRFWFALLVGCADLFMGLPVCFLAFAGAIALRLAFGTIFERI